MQSGSAGISGRRLSIATTTRTDEYQPLLVPVGDGESTHPRVAVVTADREAHAEISSCLAMLTDVVLVDSGGGAVDDRTSDFRGVDVFISTFGEIAAVDRPPTLPSFPGARLIVTGPPADGPDLISAARKSAWAYFSADEPLQEMGVVIQRVHAGESPLLRAISGLPEAAALAHRFFVDEAGPVDELATEMPASNPLTEREAQILAAVVEGDSSDEIAERLNLTSQTVRNQISPILQKLGARTRGQAAATALRNGWLDAVV